MTSPNQLQSLEPNPKQSSDFARFIHDANESIRRGAGIPAHMLMMPSVPVHDEFAQIGIIEPNEHLYPLLPTK